MTFKLYSHNMSSATFILHPLKDDHRESLIREWPYKLVASK